MKEEIKKQIEDALKEMSVVDAPEVALEIPADPRHGDWASSVPLQLAKKLNKSPMEIATEMADLLGKSLGRRNRNIERVEAVSPGFVNVYLSKAFFAKRLRRMLRERHAGKGKRFRGEKIMVEYTDANILKEFHIGHLMNNAIGEAIARSYEFQGAKVCRVCYQGDVGLHVAKAIWGKLQQPQLEWGAAYAYGAQRYKENRQAIMAINKQVYRRSDEKINRLYDRGKKESLAQFEKIYRMLGTKFRYYFFESETSVLGKEMVEEYLGSVFEKGENGAVIFNGEKYQLHTRVFITAEGLPTYEAKDLALPRVKYQRFRYDTSLVITANEQADYFKVMLAALSQIEPELAAKTRHIGHGMMRLPEGKMASRTGNVVAAELLLRQAEAMVREKMRGRDFSEAEKSRVARQVAVGAVKYAILRQRVGGDIVYRPEQAVSFEGDSGPYLQYSYVRAVSVLEKAKRESVQPSLKITPQEIGALEKTLCRFADVASSMHIHQTVTYLTELAAAFNAYYAEHQIVNSQDDFSPYKVAVTEIFAKVMQNGLWLLGIESPEKM